MTNKEKNIRDRVNFMKYISYFLLGFFVYSSVMISFIVMTQIRYTFNDFIIIFLPLPIFIILIIYLVHKDEQIKLDNIIVNKEIERIKQLYEARKKAEDYFNA